MTKTYTLNNSQVSADQIRRLLKENPELLEEKGYKLWRAENGEEYCFVDSDGDVDSDDDWNAPNDNFRYLTGNYFATREEAEAHKARLEAIGRVTHAILEANEGWEPDWSDKDEKRYYIYHSYFYNGFDWGAIGQNQVTQTLPFAKSHEIVNTIIAEHEADLRIIFNLD